MSLSKLPFLQTALGCLARIEPGRHYCPERPLLFYHDNIVENGKHREDSNIRPIQMCYEVLQHLRHNLLPGRSVLIVTSNQRQTDEVNEAKWPKIGVTTINESQGWKADVVIFMTISSKNQSIGFLDDRHKVCQAISAAKILCIFIGDVVKLQSYSVWKDILDEIEINGTIVTGNNFQTSYKISLNEVVRPSSQCLVAIHGLPFRLTLSDLKHHLKHQFHMDDVNIEDMIQYPENDCPQFEHFLGGYSGNFLFRTADHYSAECLRSLGGKEFTHRFKTRHTITVLSDVPQVPKNRGRVVIVRGYLRIPNSGFEEDEKFLKKLMSGYNIQAFKEYRNGKHFRDFSVGLVFETEEIAGEVVYKYDGFTFMSRGQKCRFQAWIATSSKIIAEMLALVDKKQLM